MTTTAYESALARLPEAYAQVLRLFDAGADDAEICRQLGIEDEALEPLLEIARRKLNRELRQR